MNETKPQHGIKNLIDADALNLYIENNQDGYGTACVAVAINVMKHLDNFTGDFNVGYSPDMTTPHGIICACDDQGGITGFMAGAARNIVARCHALGWKFWLADVISEGDIEQNTYQKYVDKLLASDIKGLSPEMVSEYVTGLIARHRARVAKPVAVSTTEQS